MIDTLWSLPDGWEWVALDKICKLLGGGTPKRSHPEYFDGDIIWVTPTDLDIDNPIQEINDSQTKITQLGLNSSSAKLLPAGTILFSSRATIGKIGIANVPLSTNQGFANLVCNEGFDNHYLAWGLKRFTENIKQLASSTTYLEISRGNLSKFKIPIPYPNNPKLSLDIQRQIVARIESLFGEIKRSRFLLEKMRLDNDLLLPNALDEVFTKLEPVTDIIPLRKMATAFNGRASGEAESNVRVFKTKHVYPHSLRMDRPSYMKPEQLAKMPKNRFLKVDDVLMANIAEGTLGRVTYVHECEENWTVDTQITIIRSLDESILYGKWLYYYLWSEKGQKEILSRRSGIAFAEKRGQTHIYPKNIVEIPVPLVPIEYQYQAVTHLDFILSKVGEIENVIKEDEQNFKYLEQAILEKAFRGEL